MIKVTYDELCDIYNAQGLQLDEKVDVNLIDGKDKLNCHCIKHPSEHLNLSYQIVKSGRFGCPSCRKENGRKDLSEDEKKNIIRSKGFEYVDGDLSNIGNMLTIKCNHGHHFGRTLNNLKRTLEPKCPFCSGKFPSGYWNKDTCQIWLDENMNGYTILDIKRDDNELRVYIKCPIKSHSPYWTSWQHIKNERTGCKQCYYEENGKIDWTLENAREKYAEFGYTMLDESQYTSSHNSVYVYDKLGFIYQVSIHFLLRGRRGFALFRNNDYAIHNIKRYLELYRPDYELVSTEYNQKKDLYLWKYLGELPDGIDPIFEQTGDAMISAECKHPALSMSAFEAKCDFILNKYNIERETQKTFNGCVYKNKLRFDFYLELNGRKYCIETDGAQHEIPVDMYGGIEEFHERQIKDEIKNQFCKDNNITLIRIKYKDSKYMEEILKRELGLEEAVA